MKILLATLALFLVFPATLPAATFDPSFHFSIVETGHFNVYFHDGLEEMAKRAATTAEEVHGKLTRLLQWEPEEKTNLVLADNSDFANGMTTVVPYNVIYLQTAPPPLSSSLGEYDNWLRILIVHEYAHVLTSDPVRGYSRVTRGVFGKAVPVGDLLNLLTFVAVGPPNMMMPRWWHEGMSTWAETELSSSGRGRSSYYQMLYRTAVAEDKLPSIDKINGEVPYWPDGNSPYIFGSGLIQYLATKYGKDLPANIAIQQSGRFPYLINGTVRDQLAGKEYETVYNEMLTHLISEQNKKIAALKTEQFTATRRLGKPDVSESNPRFSPDGTMLAFNRNDRHSHPVIVIQKTDGTEIGKIRRLPGDGALAWHPDNGSIFFCQGQLSPGKNLYQDLYRYDLKNKRLKRLTWGMRTAEPDLSPDGKRIAVVINNRGGQNIGLLKLEDVVKGDNSNSPEVLTKFKEERISSPRWSPDGKRIVFARTDRSGKASLELITPETTETRILLKDGSTIDSPTWSSDGAAIFYSSDRTGVFNIYRYDLASAATTQVSHLLSGAFSPDISAADQSLAIGEYSSSGSTVAIIPRENFRASDQSSPNIKNDLYPVNSSLAESDAEITSPLPQPAPYSPLPTLLPKFWLPALLPETSSSTAWGAMTAGQDVLAYHTYIVKAFYGPDFNRGYFDTLYQYGRFVPELTLRGYALPVTYGNLLRSGDFTEMERGLRTAVTLPLERLESGLTIKAGYHLRHQSPLTQGQLVAFNGNQVFQGNRSSLFAGIDYNSSLRYPWSITSEEGRSFSLDFEYFGRETGSEIETKQYSATWEEHIPLSRHHNILGRLSAGFADGQQAAQQSFQLGGTISFLNPFGLRGYQSHFTSGSRIATGTLEYRFPLDYILSGSGTSPLFYDRLHGALFVDAGEAWDRERSFKGSDIMTGVGAEIRLDMTLGYWLKITPAIGYAHGFNKPFGTDQLYFNIYANL